MFRRDLGAWIFASEVGLELLQAGGGGGILHVSILPSNPKIQIYSEKSEVGLPMAVVNLNC